MGIAPKGYAIHGAKPILKAALTMARKAIESSIKTNPATQRGWVSGTSNS